MNQTKSDDAPNTSASMKLRLKCNPSKLPEPPYQKPVVKKPWELSKQAMLEVGDFFYAQRQKRRTKWLKQHKSGRRRTQ